MALYPLIISETSTQTTDARLGKDGQAVAHVARLCQAVDKGLSECGDSRMIAKVDDKVNVAKWDKFVAV